MTKKYKIVTLGCKTNQYESESFAKQLRSIGFVPAKKEEADLCILNLCSVTENASISSKNNVRALRKNNPNAQIMITGCIDQKTREILEKDEKVQIFSSAEKHEMLKTIFPKVSDFSIDGFESHTRSFVKIQDGCNDFCSYCIIPFLRGRSKSRKMEAILEEIYILVQNGYKEIVLTGINIGDFYAENKKQTLPYLLDQIEQIEGLERIRISSINPNDIDDALIEKIATSKKIMPSLHVSLQSGSDRILKLMNRRYRRGDIYPLIEKLYQEIDHFTLTTDMIVGFVSETKEDFLESVKLIEDFPFAKVHIFPYSKREGTLSAKMEEEVPTKIKTERKKILQLAATKSSLKCRKQFLDKTMPILLENQVDEEGNIYGYTPNYLRVKVASNNLLPNDIIMVKLDKIYADGFIGNAKTN